MWRTLYSWQILTKLEFSRQMFEKSSNIKCHQNPSSGNRVVSCGRTDRHDEANSCFSRNFANASKKTPNYELCCTEKWVSLVYTAPPALFGGLGVEDQRKAPAKSRCCHVTCLCGWATEEACRSKPRTRDEQQIPHTFAAVHLDVLRKTVTFKVLFSVHLCDINDNLPTNTLQYFFIIHIELLHVSASNGHLQGAVDISQKHQTDMLQCRLCLSGPD